MGFLPIRDICSLPASSCPLPAASSRQPPCSQLEAGSWKPGALPHVTEDFPPDARLDSLAPGHHAAGRRQDACAEPGEDVGYLVAPEVHPAAGPAHSLEAGD